MSTIKVTNIQATGETASRTVSGVAAAWCNWSGTTTIRDSVNVSSLTDAQTGVTEVNYTNNLANSSYTNSGMAKQNSGGSDAFMRLSSTISVSLTRVVCADESGADVDGHTQTVQTFGDLA